MADKSKLIELARKIQALADRGLGGEKATASRMLEDFLRKHNMTLDDIETETREVRFFQFMLYHQDLFWQIVDSVLGTTSHWAVSNKKTEVGIISTASEEIEIKLKYETYSRHYEKEVKLFYRAFVQKNDIYWKGERNPED
jgi:hypothetical protein